MSKIPGILKNQAPAQEIQIPAVVLPPGVQIQTQKAPNGDVHFIIGPMFMVLPFTGDGAKSVADDLRGSASGVLVPSGPVVG